MALKIKKETNFGVIANYHKIESQYINWTAQTMRVVISSYVDEAARKANKTPLNTTVLEFSKNASIPELEFDFSPTDYLVDKTYEKIRALVEFKSSKDC